MRGGDVVSALSRTRGWIVGGVRDVGKRRIRRGVGPWESCAVITGYFYMISFSTTLQAIPTASVQAMRKPARGFGALFEKSSRGKAKPLNGNASEQGKNEGKVEQIKASVFLPFFSFSGGNNISERSLKENPVLPPQFAQSPEQTSKSTTAIVEDVIPLEDGIATEKNSPCGEENGAAKSVADVAESHMSLSDLSAGFQRCSQLISERRNSELKRGRPPSQEPQPLPDLKPFDYAAARSKIKFGEAGQGIKREKADVSMTGGRPPASSRDARNSFRPSRDDGEQRERGQQPRRRQAFPASGNRSTSYRC